jgi:hypothetical protein
VEEFVVVSGGSDLIDTVGVTYSETRCCLVRRSRQLQPSEWHNGCTSSDHRTCYVCDLTHWYLPGVAPTSRLSRGLASFPNHGRCPQPAPLLPARFVGASRERELVFGLGRAAGSQLWGSWTLSSRTAVDGGKMEWNEMGERERAVMS